MSESDRQRGLVPHPRFGDRSVPSGYEVPRELIRATYCYDRLPVFPDSAIPAEVSRQHYSVRPLPCYVDVMKRCHKCDRDFIFFAREQQYWFEVLRFWVDAECLHCPECRQSNHHLRQVFQRFSRTINRGDLGDEELATLVEDAVFLFEASVLRNEKKLRRLKNIAKARIPGNEATRAIVSLVTKLKAGRNISA